MRSSIIHGICMLLLTFATATTVFGDKKSLNVMFIIVGYLRAELGAYGCGQMKTPNFDRLAKQSMHFNRAYVQQAICCASRASFLTGCRPDSTGVEHPYTPWFNTVFRKKYKPIRASRASALWCAESVKLLWQNRNRFIKKPEQPAAKATYARAIKTYERIAAESP